MRWQPHGPGTPEEEIPLAELPTLRPDDILAAVKYLVELKNGADPDKRIDDIDHLGNRRVRVVGELLENQYRIGLVRMERAIKERMSLQEIETLMPHDLINSKPVTAVVKEFFGSSQLSQFMDQTNPLSAITHKRRLSALGPGGLTRERAGFEVRDVHPTHYGRICPIETPEGPNIGLIASLSTYARVNDLGFIETPYRAVSGGRVSAEVKYLTALDEERLSIAQANAQMDEHGQYVSDVVQSRQAGEFVQVPPEAVDMMDVSPSQLVSVAAALIPFLENDDANRALMGSNMQRQAVPLLRTEAPLVGTGMEAVVARDSGVTVVAKRDGVVESVDASRIVVKPDDDSTGSNVDIINLIKYQRSNQNTCINQKPIVKPGSRVRRGQVIADGPATERGELALGRNVLVAFMPWGGYNFEDSILISERVVKDDSYTSIHIEEFECVARDTKLGKEDITRDIPNVGEEALKDLDESGIVRIGAEVKQDDVLVGKITPKGETQLSPEERLLRAIFGEKAGDVRDTSLRVPPGVAGTVIGAQVFSRRGVEKDERARAIEEAEIDRLRKDQDDEIRIIRESALNKVREVLTGKRAANRVADDRKQLVWIEPRTAITRRGARAGAAEPLEGHPARGRARPGADRPDLRVDRGPGQRHQGGVRREDRAAAQGRRAAAGRVQDGEGLPRHQTQALGRRQDGRPPRQQGRDLADPARRGHAVHGRRLAGRHRAEPARRAVAHEHRPDPRDPSRVGRARARRADRRDAARRRPRQGSGGGARGAEGHLRRRAHLARARPGVRRGDPRARREPVAAACTWRPRCSTARRRTRSATSSIARACRSPGRPCCSTGASGEPFDHEVTVGVLYMLKLHHLADDKIHARSIGPYSLVTQQPLGGKAQFGGQRLGEMEVWALEAYGAAFALQEFLTVKSDDVQGRTRIYESIVKGENVLEPGLPESFNVLVKELQALGLDVELIEDKN